MLQHFLGPVRAHNPNDITIGSPVFPQMPAECPYTLQWASLSPSKLPLSLGRSGSPSNTWFPGPTRVLNPNSISVGLAAFAGLTSVTERRTDQLTDHATWSVTAGMGTRRQWPRPRVVFTSRDKTEMRRSQILRRDRDVEMHVVINAVVNKLTYA